MRRAIILKPLYQSIYERIKEDIRNGTLGAKSKLRSKRKMAESLGVSVSTIDGAYGQL
ncbi:MAG: GntR family transcriptional regulator, partial [Clostridia bacterium]